jgi:hypothetical protein
MKKLHKFLALAAFTPFLAACTPSHEDLCNHLMDLSKKENPDADKEVSEEDKKKGMEMCVEMMEKQKTKVGEDKWKEMSKCVMAADNEEAMEKCEPKDEKKE